MLEKLRASLWDLKFATLKERLALREPLRGFPFGIALSGLLALVICAPALAGALLIATPVYDTPFWLRAILGTFLIGLTIVIIPPIRAPKKKGESPREMQEVVDRLAGELGLRRKVSFAYRDGDSPRHFREGYFKGYRLEMGKATLCVLDPELTLALLYRQMRKLANIDSAAYRLSSFSGNALFNIHEFLYLGQPRGSAVNARISTIEYIGTVLFRAVSYLFLGLYAIWLRLSWIDRASRELEAEIGAALDYDRDIAIQAAKIESHLSLVEKPVGMHKVSDPRERLDILDKRYEEGKPGYFADEDHDEEDGDTTPSLKKRIEVLRAIPSPASKAGSPANLELLELVKKARNAARADPPAYDRFAEYREVDPAEME